jgi:hypothetical protein
MPLKREQGIVTHHATTIIGNLDKLLAAGFDLNPDSSRAGIQRIFQKLLDYGCRALDHFTCRNLIGDVFGMRPMGVKSVSQKERGKAKRSANTKVLAIVRYVLAVANFNKASRAFDRTTNRVNER